MDIKAQVAKAAIREIEEKTWGATEQYLEIHDIVRVNGIPHVARVDLEDDGVGIVYFPIVNEKFFLAIYLDTTPEVSIRAINGEANNRVYLRASSDVLTYEQITSASILQATAGWNKGDLKKNGKTEHNYSCAIYEPNPEPDSFEDKLSKLLHYLSQDRDGIVKLINLTEYAYIQADIETHNGNGLIGGPMISKSNIKRMADMNLEIAFSQYVTGNPFR